MPRISETVTQGGSFFVVEPYNCCFADWSYRLEVRGFFIHPVSRQEGTKKNIDY